MNLHFAGTVTRTDNFNKYFQQRRETPSFTTRERAQMDKALSDFEAAIRDIPDEPIKVTVTCDAKDTGLGIDSLRKKETPTFNILVTDSLDFELETNPNNQKYQYKGDLCNTDSHLVNWTGFFKAALEKIKDERNAIQDVWFPKNNHKEASTDADCNV
jgi:hypothetical protein